MNIETDFITKEDGLKLDPDFNGGQWDIENNGPHKIIVQMHNTEMMVRIITHEIIHSILFEINGKGPAGRGLSHAFDNSLASCIINGCDKK